MMDQKPENQIVKKPNIQRKANIPFNVRSVVYSYLTAKEIGNVIQWLSKKDREIVQKYRNILINSKLYVTRIDDELHACEIDKKTDDEISELNGNDGFGFITRVVPRIEFYFDFWNELEDEHL